MVKRFCDRCGKEIPRGEITYSAYIGTGCGEPEEVATEICGNCQREIEDFVAFPSHWKSLLYAE